MCLFINTPPSLAQHICYVYEKLICVYACFAAFQRSLFLVKYEPEAKVKLTDHQV